MKENCLFCKIIAGELPSSVVYEDEKFMAIMDIFPAARGHVIILTKKHYANLFDLGEEEANKLLAVAKKIAHAMKEELCFEGMNILQNSGVIAGQTVDHFHLHLIPRSHMDQVTFTWKTGKYAEGEATSLAEAIADKI